MNLLIDLNGISIICLCLSIEESLIFSTTCLFNLVCTNSDEIDLWVGKLLLEASNFKLICSGIEKSDDFEALYELVSIMHWVCEIDSSKVSDQLSDSTKEKMLQLFTWFESDPEAESLLKMMKMILKTCS